MRHSPEFRTLTKYSGETNKKTYVIQNLVFSSYDEMI